MPRMLATLLQQTPAKVQQRARKVHVINFIPRRHITRRGLGENSFWSVQYKTTGTGGPHTCRFKFYSAGVGKTVPTWVWCDCADFKYREEYVLARKAGGSSSIINAKNRPPKVTNPRMEVRLCKHLLKITKVIPQINEYLRQKKKVEFGRRR